MDRHRGPALFLSIVLVCSCHSPGPFESELGDYDDAVRDTARACDNADWEACLRLGQMAAAGRTGQSVGWPEPIETACLAGLDEACEFAADRWLDGAGSGEGLREAVEDSLHARCTGDQPDVCVPLMDMYQGEELVWPDERDGTPQEMARSACRRGAQAVCDAIVPERAGLYVRQADQWVAVPPVREHELEGVLDTSRGLGDWREYDVLLDTHWERVVRAVDEETAIVLVTDAAQPPRNDTYAARAERDHYNVRHGRADARFIRDRQNCLTMTSLGDRAFEMKLPCPPGEYFVHFVHPPGVEDTYFAIEVNTIGQFDPVQPDASHCGHPDFNPGVPGETWRNYMCMSQQRAGEDWSRCLPRSGYSPTRGAGCPGEERCCPPW